MGFFLDRSQAQASLANSGSLGEPVAKPGWIDLLRLQVSPARIFYAKISHVVLLARIIVVMHNVLAQPRGRRS
jgi:hypothetical protein